MLTTASKPNSTQNPILDLMFNLYLFGRKIKHQVKQGHSEHVHDQMLEFSILKLIATNPKSVSELAELLSTGLSAMSEKIKSLKDLGLISQVTGNDAREKLCQILPAGLAVINQAKSKMAETCLPFAESLSETEINQLNQLIKKMVFTFQDKESELQ